MTPYTDCLLRLHERVRERDAPQKHDVANEQLCETVGRAARDAQRGACEGLVRGRCVVDTGKGGAVTRVQGGAEGGEGVTRVGATLSRHVIAVRHHYRGRSA